MNTQRRKVLGWRVWYDGGRVFDSRSTTWADLPDDGLQVLVLYCDKSHRVLVRPDEPSEQLLGVDWYFQAPGPGGELLYGASMVSEAEIRRRYPRAILKRGRWTTLEELDAQQEAASRAVEPP